MNWILKGSIPIPIQSRLGSNSNEGVLQIPQTLEMEPHYQMQFSAELGICMDW